MEQVAYRFRWKLLWAGDLWISSAACQIDQYQLECAAIFGRVKGEPGIEYSSQSRRELELRFFVWQLRVTEAARSYLPQGHGTGTAKIGVLSMDNAAALGHRIFVAK